MPRHRQEAERPIPVEVVEEPPTRGQRIRGIIRRAALLALFALSLIILLTLIAEVRYGRGLLQEQIEQSRDDVRDRELLLDRVEEQTARIDALVAQLDALGVQPAGRLPSPAPAAPAVPGPAPGDRPNPGRPDGDRPASTGPDRPAASSPSASGPASAAPASPGPTEPPPATPRPTPAPPVPCLLELPGLGCAVPLPGAALLAPLAPAAVAGFRTRRRTP